MQIFLRIGLSILLIGWGALNILAGLSARQESPSALVFPIFLLAGGIVVLAGVGFMGAKPWGLRLLPIGLGAILAAALFSAVKLRGWHHIQWAHHAQRLVISLALWGLATYFVRWRERRASDGR